MKKIYISKQILIILITAFLYTNSNAQQLNLAWAKSMQSGNSGWIESLDVCQDRSGNYILTGRFQDIIDFDPGPAVYNLNANLLSTWDVFIVKMNSQGNFIWAKQLPGYGNARAKGICSDDDNNIYVTGNFIGSTDFDPNAGTHYASSIGVSDMFVLKLDSLGEFKWVKTMGGSGSAEGWDIACDHTNQLVITGFYNGTFDIDPGPSIQLFTSTGSSSNYFFKMDSSGNLVWAKNLNCSGFVTMERLCVDTSNHIYVVGEFSGTMDVDPGVNVDVRTSTTGWASDILILKSDNNGNFLWAQTMGDYQHDVANSVCTDINQNVIITGSFQGTIDFDTSPSSSYTLTSAGSDNAFTLKLNSQGNFRWVSGVIGIGYVVGYTVNTDQQGRVFCSGNFSNSVDFDPSINSYFLDGQNGFIYVVNYDSSGNFILANQYGSNTWGTSVTETLINPQGNIISTGRYSSTTDFDPDTSSYYLTASPVLYTYGAYLTEIRTCYPNNTFIADTACDQYSFNSNILTSSGTYLDTLISMKGCDSILHLDLTIHSSEQHLTIDTVCTQFVWNGNTYAQSGTYSNSFINSAGCDSIENLQLLVANPNDTIFNSGSYLGASSTIGYSYQWVNCDELLTAIPGATNSQFTPSQSGNYAVIITNLSCIDTSQCISFTPDNIHETNLSTLFQLYPNPSNDKLYIESNLDTKIIRTEIHSIDGKLVQKNTSFQDYIHIENLDDGIYYLKLYYLETSTSLFFIKRN